MATSNVRVEIQRLYDAIHAYAQRFDPQAVPKRVIERALTSEVFLIAQAPGPRTQRLTGIPYVEQNGRLSGTGRRLDDFLGRFGYTVDLSDHGRRYVYSTDMVQHYTGPGRQGDRPPSRQEREQYADWLDRELALIAPKVIVLLGSTAIKAFFKQYLNKSAQPLVEIGGMEFLFDHHGRRISVFAVYHPAHRFGDREDVEDIYEEAAETIALILED